MNIDPPAGEDAIVAQAAAWLLRQQDASMDADAWGAFGDWLGRDPRHAAIYDELVEADTDLVALARQGVLDSEASVTPRHWGRLYALVGAVAAVLVAALVLPGWLGGPRFTSYATAALERRDLTIAPGITVAMNANSRIAVSDAKVPVVRLESGEAAFVISRPAPSGLRVEVAGLTLVDEGTVFDVVRDARGVRIAVAKGKVTVNPETRPVSLLPGQTLDVPLDGDARRGAADPAAMLGWREGLLSWEGAPAAQVAADLARNLGVKVEVAPAVARRRFSGVLQLRGGAAAVLPEAAGLLGARAVRTADGWRIEPQ